MSEIPVTYLLMVRVFGVVLSEAPFYFHRLSGWTKKAKAPPEYKR